MEVNRLKVRQEKMELEELQNMNENQLTYLWAASQQNTLGMQLA